MMNEMMLSASRLPLDRICGGGICLQGSLFGDRHTHLYRVLCTALTPMTHRAQLVHPTARLCSRRLRPCHNPN